MLYPFFSGRMKCERLNENPMSSVYYHRHRYQCCYSICVVLSFFPFLIFTPSGSRPALFHIPLRLWAVCPGGVWWPLWLRSWDGYRGQPWSWKQTGKGKCITATIQCQATEKSPRLEATSRETWGSSHSRGVRTLPRDNDTAHFIKTEKYAFCCDTCLIATHFVLLFRIIQQLVNGIIAPTAMPNIGVGPWWVPGTEQTCFFNQSGSVFFLTVLMFNHLKGCSSFKSYGLCLGC